MSNGIFEEFPGMLASRGVLVISAEHAGNFGDALLLIKRLSLHDGAAGLHVLADVNVSISQASDLRKMRYAQNLARCGHARQPVTDSVRDPSTDARVYLVEDYGRYLGSPGAA